ncbi:MAG: outer membrane beta-barrel protein [Psychrilyobacter sp.]|nr:outer membrane beta-barrel protein [Psychrilyobacter sp.]
MKKLLLITLLLGATTTAFADKYLETRIGLTGFGTYNDSGSNVTKKYKTTGVGFDAALEFMSSVNDNFYLGAGVAYQTLQESKSHDEKLFQSFPVYGVAKYSLGYLGDSAWVPFIKANLGYAFNFKDGGNDSPDNGLYYALGGGIENDGVVLEISYQDTYSEINHTNYDYSRWTFGIGYRFR